MSKQLQNVFKLLWNVEENGKIKEKREESEGEREREGEILNSLN